MARVADRPIKKLPTLRGRTVVNLFFEDSTRTRISFEAAAKRLSADVINFSAKGSSVSKGESPEGHRADPGGDGRRRRRHPARRLRRAAPARHSGWIDAAVVNAGDGTHEHPTQALLDAFTMRRRLAAGRRARTWPASGSRSSATSCTAGSPAPTSLLLHTLGAEVTLVAPPTLLPVGVERWPVRRCPTTSTPSSPKSDAVMMLRVQRERMNAALLPDRARVLPALRPRRPPDGAAARARHRDAPRPDGPRHGDHRRGRRLARAAHRRAGRQRRRPSGWPCCTCCSAAREARGRQRPTHRTAAERGEQATHEQPS